MKKFIAIAIVFLGAQTVTAAAPACGGMREAQVFAMVKNLVVTNTGNPTETKSVYQIEISYILDSYEPAFKPNAICPLSEDEANSATITEIGPAVHQNGDIVSGVLVVNPLTHQGHFE